MGLKLEEKKTLVRLKKDTLFFKRGDVMKFLWMEHEIDDDRLYTYYLVESTDKTLDRTRDKYEEYILERDFEIIDYTYLLADNNDGFVSEVTIPIDEKDHVKEIIAREKEDRNWNIDSIEDAIKREIDNCIIVNKDYLKIIEL